MLLLVMNLRVLSERHAKCNTDIFRHVPGVQPRMMPHEYDAVEKLLLSHPEFLQALLKRGIKDPTLVKAGKISEPSVTDQT